MAMAEAREAIRLTFELRQPAYCLRLRRCGRSRPSASVSRADWPRSRRRASSCNHTAWLDAQGGRLRRPGLDGPRPLAGDLVNQVLYDCVQFHGGMGFIRETRGRAHAPRCPRAGDRRRRVRGHAGRGRASGSGRPCQTEACQHGAGRHDRTTVLDDYEVGQKFPWAPRPSPSRRSSTSPASSTRSPSTSIPRRRSSHCMAASSPRAGTSPPVIGGFVDNYVDRRTRAGARPASNELRWLKPVRAGDHAEWHGDLCGQGAVQEPAHPGHHPRALGSDQPEGRLVMTTKGINRVRRRPS